MTIDASTSAWLRPSYIVRRHASPGTAQTHRISGAATGFRAVNLRSETAERTGAGLLLARVPRKRIRERGADLEL
jgi:hypothetical protein